MFLPSLFENRGQINYIGPYTLQKDFMKDHKLKLLYLHVYKR